MSSTDERPKHALQTSSTCSLRFFMEGDDEETLYQSRRLLIVLVSYSNHVRAKISEEGKSGHKKPTRFDLRLGLSGTGGSDSVMEKLCDKHGDGYPQAFVPAAGSKACSILRGMTFNTVIQAGTLRILTCAL